MKTNYYYPKIREIRNKAFPQNGEILYRCNRVWEAWQMETMTEDDFEEVEPEFPVSLNDVLRMIRDKVTIRIRVDADEILIFNKDEEHKVELQFVIDLSKSIQKQPEKVLKKILKILQ